jgi:hypothetical protein
MERPLSSYIPIGTAIACPRRTLSNAGLILFAGILVGIVIPGCFYKLSHTFDLDDVAHNLPSHIGTDHPLPKDVHVDPKEEWNAYTKTKDGLKRAIEATDARIADETSGLMPQNGTSGVASKNTAVSSKLSGLVEQRAKLVSALESLKANPPFHVSGFYLEYLMFVWPAFYTCLGWLILILPPNYPHRARIRPWALFFIGTLVLYRWFTWIRNIPCLRYIERHVYANGNWDVSIGSFFIQELQAVVACLLLVVFWATWADFIPVWQEQVRECLWRDESQIG